MKTALITGITGQDGSYLAEFLLEKGYDKAYGARQLRRTVERFLEDPLAEEILRGQILNNSVVTVRANKEKLAFKGEPVEIEKPTTEE